MTLFSAKQLARLQWQHYRRVPHLALDANWRPWLLDRGSLTQRLVMASQGAFRVQVMSQRVDTPLVNESRALNIRSRARCFIREVALLCHGIPVVFARSVIPESTLKGEERQLRFLGNKPLGAFLFKNPGMRRGPLEISRFSTAVFDTQPCNPQPASILELSPTPAGWARRSVFYLHERPLLVCEFFTSDVLHIQHLGRKGSQQASPLAGIEPRQHQTVAAID